MKTILDYLSGSPLTGDPTDIDQLFETLIERRSAILVSCVCVWIIAFIGLYLTGSTWPIVWGVADTILTAWRWRLLTAAMTAPPRKRTAHRLRLNLLTIVWSAVFGLGASWSVQTGDLELTVIASVFTATIISVFSFRNAATPRVAWSAIAITGLLFLSGMASSSLGLTWAALALSIPWLVGLSLMTMQSHRLLLRLIAAERQSKRLAHTDDLTGLPNRAHFSQHKDAIANRSRHDDHYAYLCVDLDGFKQVNDRYGHPAGDELLRMAATRMMRTIRKDDVIFRMGGDEFVFFLPGADGAACVTVANRVVEALSEPFSLSNGETICIGASAGSACLDEAANAATELLKVADEALYRAKRQGRGRHVHASEPLDQAHPSR